MGGEKSIKILNILVLINNINEKIYIVSYKNIDKKKNANPGI